MLSIAYKKIEASVFLNLKNETEIPLHLHETFDYPEIFVC
jgi:hypothetical protein